MVVCTGLVLALLGSYAGVLMHTLSKQARQVQETDVRASAQIVAVKDVVSRNTTIRQWGSQLHQAPLIMMHIGKCAGGQVQSYLAQGKTFGSVAFLNNALMSLCFKGADEVHAFCPKFGGHRDCDAVTPIGMAVGCADARVDVQRRISKGYKYKNRTQSYNCTLKAGQSCRLVTTGHFFIGAEMSLLPLDVLEEAAIEFAAMHLTDNTGTIVGSSTNVTHIDELSLQAFKAKGAASWTGFYSHLPVVRTVVAREPFSWLASIHDWTHTKMCLQNTTWIDRFAHAYLFVLCGQECHARVARGISTMDELELQAHENLKHLFAVVGLVENMSQFPAMVRKRFSYMSEFGLGPPPPKHKAHMSTPSKCKTSLQDPRVRAALVAEKPSVGMLLRLYETAVAVNRVHMAELQLN